jgi:hypothetical protein
MFALLVWRAVAINGLVIVAAQPLTGAWLGRRDHSAALAISRWEGTVAERDEADPVRYRF